MDGSEKIAVAALLIEILRQAPGIKPIVTSREALDIQGEWTFEIQGLSFPELEHAGNTENFSAVALFMQRARPTFVLDEKDPDAIVYICHLVEGCR